MDAAEYKHVVLAIRGIDGQITHGDSFHNDRFPDLEADCILANPPFNVSDWRGELRRESVRAQLRVLVKRIIRKYDYPPDKKEKATRTVIEQAKTLSEEWAVS